ncbi:hypothetical protein BGZ75_008025 [Mortierella antarctica]|nr:hypothetical protein BGZ75_008025 [Mortierella antarctica]
MSDSIEFAPLATSDPMDEEPITTKPAPRSKRNTLSARVERLTDAAISGLGPVLITIAFVLLSTTIFCFFTVFLPFHYQWKGGEGPFGNWAYILNVVWSWYLVWGIIGNYYFAVRTPPGAVLDGVASTGDAMFQDVLQEMETYTELPPTCKRCHLPKPERTHHCSVCKRCVLKYDHHCPWIHNCVGFYNHRYFVMFLTYLSTACVYFVLMGAEPFMLAADLDSETTWPYWLDQSIVAFSEVLAVAIGIAVGGMACWHWYLTLTAQTTLEQYNNAYIKKVCKKRGEKFTNMYDFGVVGNLQDFFNVGPRGHYPWYTALLPLRIPPIGNGKRFERSGRGYVLDFGEEDEDMPVLALQIKAELENVTELIPADADHTWHFKVQCTKCRDIDSNFITFNAIDKAEMGSGRGEANLVMRCKFCKCEISADFASKPVTYDIENNDKFATIVTIECRGLELVGFEPREGWKAKGAESGTVFEDIDLTEGDWADYDEKSELPVAISNIEAKFVKVK